MTNRWVCARCFTSAEESATACPNCGLPRGMAPDSVAGDAPPAADESPTTEAPYRATEPPAPAPEPQAATAAAPVPQSAQPPAWAADERWVCRRCFSSNDGGAAACAKCGQVRDMNPSAEAAGGAGWAPPQPVAQRGGGFPWRLVMYGVIALVVFGGSVLFAARRGDSGEITDAGTLSVFDLQVGDCFDADIAGEQATQITEVRAVPCAEPHVYEMFSVAEYPAGEVPSEVGDYTPWEEDNCIGRFEGYVGLDYESSVYYISVLSPSDASWADGDRLLQCFLHNSTESPLSGSARGSAR